MRAFVAVIASGATVVVTLAGCSRDEEPVTRPPRDFCLAAAELDERLSAGADVDEQVRLVRRLDDTAPPEIADETRVFLEALEAVQADPDDPERRDDPEVREAVDDVNRFATQGCELYEREGGGGLF